MRSFSASAAHKGLWLAQKMTPDTLNHAMTMWEVNGALDTAAMESAFRHVMDEAEVLRVNFVDDDNGLRLAVQDLGDWRPFFLDLSAEPDPDQAAREALADIVKQPFDLEHDLLFRLGAVTLAPDRCLVVLAYHHLISDGFGAGGLLSRRLAEVYTALVSESEIPPQPHPWDAASFANEATRYLASDTFTEDTEFWRDYLKDAPAPAQVPRIALTDTQRSALDEPMSSADRWSEVAGSIGMVSRTLTVPRAEADTWTQAAQSMGVWMSSMLTAAAAVFFRHRCDHPEFLLSLAVGNRVGAAATTPGLAVNVVPVRIKVPLTATFAEIADAVVDETYEIFGHTACHYSDIQRASGTVLSGRGSYGAVMNVVEFVEQLHFADHPARYFPATTGVFDELSIGLCTDGSPDSDLFLRLDAPATLYSRAELRVIGAELIDYIRAVVAAQEQPLGALDVIGGAAREQVLTAPNNTATPLPELTVAQLFTRQAQQTPDAIAVQLADTALSYRDLDERSHRLAQALRRHQVGPETVVAVALPRSADLITALLGVAKTGGAYLPLDPATPAERLKPALTDAAARVLLTDATTAKALSADLDIPAIQFDDLAADSPGAGSDRTQDSPAPARPDNLLAVMHATDPTGTPTTVALTHRSIQRLALDRTLQQGARQTVLWHTPPTSDALPLEVWAPLLNGGRVVVAPPGDLDTDALSTLQAAHRITTAWLPAGMLCAIAAEHPQRLAALREVWTGGDRVPAAALRRIREACPDLTVVHGHGPAETTVLAAAHRLAAGEPPHHAGAAGHPADNTALYVLGPGLAPVPAGVSGELYVAGPGIARGYPAHPAQTAHRFVPCPFGPPGTLMHRTGDRVRWSAEGHLEYVGRTDTQADIRGVRTESAEIEEALSEHPGLAHVVVVARNDDAGQQRLIAYAVPARGHDSATDLSSEELRRYAAERLAEPMVPSVFVLLERLPLTAGGRVDRTSLPEPESGDDKYRAPRNRTERVLAEAFADVLELDRLVGIDEDFFDLGGNSLRAIRLVSLIRAELNQEVSIRTLFAARTITGLSDKWKDLAQSSRPTLSRRTKAGEVL
ncbi:amino acid adenylation domain-containing protein [Streptomyces aurantiacus]|nr:amino acid adenylation domain-containing protein [Streptomyces aurantiacus]